MKINQMKGHANSNKSASEALIRGNMIHFTCLICTHCKKLSIVWNKDESVSNFPEKFSYVNSRSKIYSMLLFHCVYRLY